MDPVTTAAVINAGSSILGGLFGGKKKKGPSLEDQYKAHLQSQRELARYLPIEQVRGWQAAGIHPIYGMSGGSAQYSSPALIGDSDGGSSLGERIQGMGEGIGRAAEALASSEERALNRRLLEAQVRTAEADADGRILSNVKLAADARLATQAGTPNPLDARYATDKDMPIGYGSAKPFWTIAQMPNGRFARVYNTNDLGDNEVLQAISSPVAVADMLHAYVGEPASKYVGRAARGIARPFKEFFKRFKK